MMNSLENCVVTLVVVPCVAAWDIISIHLSRMTERKCRLKYDKIYFSLIRQSEVRAVFIFIFTKSLREFN